jgi:hypothetical protein
MSDLGCPGCAAPMTRLALEAHAGGRVEIDLCGSCHAFWFDQYETLRLAPASTLRLFGVIGDSASIPRGPLPEALRCPRCSLRLAVTHDLQRATRFRYWRCPRGHGRFMTFLDFLREKDFIRPLSATQMSELRKNLQTVNCSSCGAPVDLARASSCAHCGSPLTMLDIEQAGRVVAQLQAAAAPKPIDPTLPLELARVRRETEAVFAQMQAGRDWWREAGSSGLVEAGLTALVRWLRGRL